MISSRRTKQATCALGLGLWLVSAGVQAADQQLTLTEEEDTTGWFLVPYVTYSPETSLAFGVGHLQYFCMGQDPGDTRLSSLRSAASYTLNEQIALFSSPQLWFDGNQHYVGLRLSYSDTPDQYSGVGDDIDPAISEPYTAITYQARIEYARMLVSDLYLGFLYHVGGTHMRELASDGLLATSEMAGVDGGLISGLGLALTWDTRDRRFSTRRGLMARLELLQFHSAIGSDYDFTRIELDTRAFLPTVLGQVLGFHVFAQSNLNHPPFYELAQLGGDEMMRGYFRGQYRDRSAWTVQTEYRLPVWWRFSVVGFAAVGAVFRELGEAFSDGALFAGGGGLRFAVDPEAGINLRADYAAGIDTSGFYFSVGEAF